MKKRLLLLVGGIAAEGMMSIALADGWNPAPPEFQTKAPLAGSIEQSRHNLTLSYNIKAGGAGAVMDIARNNYGEICVYCHTPHGANTQIKAPIWNRTINVSEYKIYDKLRTLNRPMSQPGPNSLTCLSCHDGTISIDSIINMPGSGKYNSAQETKVDKAWLDTWGGLQNGHFEIGTPAQFDEPVAAAPVGGKCIICHSKASLAGAGGNYAAPDFSVFVISTDLRNDHPIGIVFPDAFGPGVDFNQPTGSIPGKMGFFDVNGDGSANTNEPRLYDTGDGPEVECASCHDPHGVPINGPGSQFIPSFLRVSNGNAGTGEGRSSGLCLTCHNK